MMPRLKLLWRKLGRIERAFLLVLVLDLVLSFTAPASGFRIIASILAWVLGIAAAVQLARRYTPQIIWRLRNRLIVAYVFIAVVPVLLIVVLMSSGAYVVTGQLAVYLINSELERRNSILAGPANLLANENAAERQENIKRVAPYLRNRFPNLEFVFKDVTGAPPRDASGFLVKDEQLYSWARVTRGRTEATLRAPVTHQLLVGLIPGLGDVFVLSGEGATVRLDSTGSTEKDSTPPAHNPFDIPITGASLVPVSVVASAKEPQLALLVVRTRLSAVLGIIFGQKFDVGQAAVLMFLGVAILFLVFELGSLIVGVSLSRTITGAVHNLYEGTQRVSHGDFSHRIAVEGKDQLAELGTSFNQMTANLERLIVVEKEKERLQSEIEIAREVQNQLFPGEPPVMLTAQVRGVCHPARMVSGDYYDFLALPNSTLALAIGDVAGKGISAALLMAAIQSTMRTQLSTGTAMAAAAGSGRSHNDLSTARLVSQLNKQLYANTSPEKYATFYFGLYDETRSTLRYTNAGHLPPILLRDGQPPTELGVTGTVVGAFPFSRYEELEIELRAGDMLVAYTDGVVEPENPYGEQFGEDRLKDMLVKYGGEPSEEIIARVMEAVEQWTASTELQDDMTMLVVRRI